MKQQHGRRSDTAVAYSHISDEEKATLVTFHPGHQPTDPDLNDSISRSIARPENMTIFLLRLIVLCVLVASATLVAATAIAVTRHAERERFEQSFMDSADTLFDAVGHSLYTTLGAIDTFVVSMVSFARYTNMEWPYVVLPNYAVQMAKIRARANVACVNQYNLVPVDQRSRWEAFASQNDEWVQEGLRIQKQDVNFRAPTEAEINAYELRSEHILGSDGPFPEDPTRASPYLVSWQSSPVMPSGSAYNWEFSNFYNRSDYLSETVGHGRVVFAEVFNVPAGDKDQVSNATIEYIHSLDPERNVTEPLSDVIYPITIGAPDSVQTDTKSPVVGFLLATVFWSDLIKHILPIGTDGVIFVFANSCGQSFSYRIDGPSVTFLGPGDLHDTTYDHLKQETTFQDLAFSTDKSKVYTGLPLSDKGCPFRLSVYPTKEYEDLFLTNDPFHYALNIVAVFGLVACLFCVWDSCVEKRQKIYSRTVKESSQNMSVLEKLVQERTQSLSQTNQRLEEISGKLAAASAAQLQTFACMSHEIRTPLNCIIGLSGLLQETELNPQQKESLSMIVSSSDLLLAVVNDILDYSKLESGKMDVDMQDSPLQDVLNSVVFAMETKAEERNITLETKLDTNVGPFLQTDPRRLQQVLFNLLGNAIKFGQAGSPVELALVVGDPLKASQDKETNIYSPTDDNLDQPSPSNENHRGSVIRFSVLNQGRGICQDDMKLIFRPFKQSFSGINQGGTGLGLAITTKLVYALGGRLVVESKPGSWAKFSVEFPYFQTVEPFPFQLSKKLNGATVALVCRRQKVIEQMRNIFLHGGVTFHSFDCMGDISQQKSSMNSATKSCLLCLVDDDLYDDRAKRDILNLQQFHKVSLTTFGSKRYGADGPIHIRSLTRTLPSVLLEHLEIQILPCAPPLRRSASIDPEGCAVEPSAYRDFRVLIAEDNIVSQKVMMRTLNRIGLHNIEIVDDGQKAVDLEAKQTFDVVLLDMQMPVMDGVQACETIVRRHSSNRLQAPKVVFVTAHVAAEIKGVCCKAGASGVISKPFKRHDIEKLFSNMYDLLQAERSLSSSRREGEGEGYGTFLQGRAIAA